MRRTDGRTVTKHLGRCLDQPGSGGQERAVPMAASTAAVPAAPTAWFSRPQWPWGPSTCLLRATSCFRLASSSSVRACMADSCVCFSRRELLIRFWVSSSSRTLLLHSSVT